MSTFEIILVVLLLGSFFCVPAVRAFCRKINRGDKITAGIIILAFILGHSLGFSRYTFPLVNWAMYSEINHNEQFKAVKLIAISADGTQTEVNPISQFPSLRRCFSSRFSKLVIAVDEKKITEHGRHVYHELFDVILENYNRQHPDRPAVEIAARVEEIAIADGTVLASRTVSRIQVQPNQFTTVSFPGGSPVISTGEANADE